VRKHESEKGDPDLKKHQRRGKGAKKNNKRIIRPTHGGKQ